MTSKRQIAEQIEKLTKDDFPAINKSDKTNYLHRPPRLRPNYGKPNRSVLPKTKISRVLLFDNSMQDQMLNVRRRYIDRQKKRVTQIFEKTKYAFQDRVTTRQRWHDSWDIRYQHMKDDFVARYGSKYMPVPSPEVDPFLINARIAPPLNILCFYIAAQEEAKQNKKLDIENVKNKIESIVDQLKPTEDIYSRSIEDPRFQVLEDTLANPGFKSDGYLQLSPVYAKVPNDKKWKPAKRQPIVLPKFYSRKNAGSPDSVHSVGSRETSAKKEPALPEIQKKEPALPPIQCDV